MPKNRWHGCEDGYEEEELDRILPGWRDAKSLARTSRIFNSMAVILALGAIAAIILMFVTN